MAKSPKKQAAPAAKIVEAVGTASSAIGRPGYGAAIQAAMVAEAEKCFAEGLFDPDKVRARKLKARDKAKAEIATAERKAQKAKSR